MAFTEKHFLGLNSQGTHKIFYNDWGDEKAQPVICVHGLTGNGHDFDYLAPALVKDGYRVIAVDLAGRSRSDFLPDPFNYNYIQYCSDLMDLLAHIGVREPASVDWIGVSLGGLLGIRLAGIENSPIRRMIINDVGPEVPKAALDFIHQVISQTYHFDNIAELEKRMHETRGLTWGPVTDEQWRHMAEHNARALDDGRITYAYDPRISMAFKNEPTGSEDLWPYWDNIKCPLMVLQGGKSLLLTDDIVNKMHERGPEFDLHVFENCGHVPSLMEPGQIEIIKAWLSTTPTS